ncbi:sulfate ABC transporter substrate-binding protein [Hyphomicrobium sp.]|jgi:sulfate transport system substrate-binding protein|uniref:sulfate ABC transporter substrate-binding protein n=1 Tax=Hyphomicrobium sp. TaxID=82 RepID=UPI003562D9AC
MITRRVATGLGVATVLFSMAPAASAAETTILNASYDVSRELYKDVDPAFTADWKKKTGEDVTVKQSHGGSTKQAQAVAEGLEADVVTLNQPTDLDFLAKKGVISADWRKQFPHAAAPYTTTSIFLVRKGNPKGIKDWDDLAKSGVSVVVPNPKTSGNGRYTYLAAWGYAKEKFGSDDKAREFVAKLFANVPVFDGGGRGATTTFTQRGIGDVLVSFENEAALIKAEVDGSNFDIVYPSLSIEAAPPVAVVQQVAEKRKTEKLAKAYLDFLYSDDAQKIIAKHHFRPQNAEILKEAHLPEIRTFNVEDKIGPWAEVQKIHFSDGGIYDQITTKQN